MTANYPRWFLLAGAAYLLIGVALGMYMGGSGEFGLSPVHAHVNLVGFTLMSVFGLILRGWPQMAASPLTRWHFWLFQLGALVMLSALFLLVSGRMAEGTIGPVLLLGEVLVVAGLLVFVANLLRHA